MQDTVANRAFLRPWFAMISEQNDAISADEIARAVSVNFDYLSDKDRMLKNLWESCFSSAGSKSALFSIKIIGKGLPSLNTSTSST